MNSSVEDSYHTPAIKNIPVGRKELWINSQAFIGIMGVGLAITSANWSYQFLSSLQGYLNCSPEAEFLILSTIDIVGWIISFCGASWTFQVFISISQSFT